MKFRKKPVVVEARRLRNRNDQAALCGWHDGKEKHEQH